MTASNITMTTPNTDGHSQSSTKYIEIDVESDDLEESKHELPAAEEDDFSDLSTQKLFNMAQRILTII